MASPTQSRSLAESASSDNILPTTVDVTWYQNPETSNLQAVSTADQLAAYYHSNPNTTSQTMQPPTTESQASQPEGTNNTDLGQIKPLNPKASIFVPAELKRLYIQHHKAYLRQKETESEMNGIQNMPTNGGEGQYNFERCKLARKYTDADLARTKCITAIEKQYGSVALGKRSQQWSEDWIDESKSIEIQGNGWL